MPVSTTTVVTCDRCRRVIASGYLWPYTFGPDGPLQVRGEICADLPNSCKDLITSVFFGVATVTGPAVDSFPR